MSRCVRRTGRVLTIAVVAVSWLSGCGELPGFLDGEEKRLGVHTNWIGADHRQFHRILHFHNGLGLQFPGYIVGTEKAHQDKVMGPKYDPDLLAAQDDGRKAGPEALRTDPKAHLVTHVMRYSPEGRATDVYPHRMRSCALYSALSPGPDGVDPLFPYCAGSGPEPDNGKAAYRNSWRALERLKAALAKDLAEGGYSHIFVVTMGWNTPQGEAVQNFNSIIGHLLDEADAQRNDREACPAGSKRPHCGFKPLLVGVTWASDWEVSPLLALPPALVRGISFPNKADDANEMGSTWLRALIEHVVLPVRNAASTNGAPKVVLIGHSFGARATMTAIKVSALSRAALPDGLRDSSGSGPAPGGLAFRPGDQFISLQGAFEVDELFEKGGYDRLLPQFVESDLRVRLIASRFDTAVDTAFWGRYAGSISGYEAVCGQATRPASLDCERVAAGAPRRDGPSSRVLYIDASEVVRYGAAFTGGGAHSDIYRRETARMLWNYID